MRQFRFLISFILLAAIYTGMLSPFISTAAAQKVSGRVGQTSNMNIIPENGLQFRLSEGAAGAETRTVTPPTQGEQLSVNETAKVLKRLPEIKSEPDDQQDFAKRAGTLPAPKTGKIIPVKFPSDENGRGTPKVNVGDTLEVLRYSPEGEVSLAPDLNVTFSQPMVAISSQEEAAQNVPVQISPQPEGRWRWLGAKTLMFDATKRLPMATRFTARVPAGTKAINGQTLKKDVVWTFTTPPPAIETKIPENTVTRRDQIVFVSFDQEINPEAVVKTISVTAGGKKIPIRLATPEEIEKDVSISYQAKAAQPKRWLAFRAVNADGSTENALPPDSQITVTVEKGTPSAEGPLTTVKPQTFTFKTFGALRFIEAQCGWGGGGECAPSYPFTLRFTNPLDGATFTKDLVQIEPAIENLEIYPSGQNIYINGIKKGRTTYTITVNKNLKDIFGQTLDAPVKKTITTTAAPAQIFSQGGSFITLDPTTKPVYSFFSTNQPSVKLQIRAVTPADWEAFRQYMRYTNYDEQKRGSLPGKLVVDKILKIEAKPDEMVETRIDLSPALNNNLGNAIVLIEPTVKRDKYDRTQLVSWTQATQIGLDAFVDNQELVGFATELKTGKPLAGVEFSILPNGKSVSGNQAGVTNEQPQKRSQSWWEWLTNWGVSDSAANSQDSQNSESSLKTAETETVAEAQSNQTSANGILRLPLPENQSSTPNLLLARKGGDVAFLPENAEYYWQDSGGWYKHPNGKTVRWFVFDDRKMYRPKEEVSVKGYLRKVDLEKLGDVGQMDFENVGELLYTIRDPRGNEIGKGKLNLNAFGAFDFKFKLPDNANLGSANIHFDLQSANGSHYTDFDHQFQIQEFRRPEFEVTAKNETEAPYFVKSSATVSINANYYAGGGLANAEANWTVVSTPTNYTPPNRDDFTFGTWIPWWRNYGINYGQSSTQTFKGVTDASGKHLLKIDFENANPPRPYNVRAEARIQDVNRQTFAASTNLLVHPADLYVGIRTPRTFVNKGEKINVESITTDIDGKAVANRDVEIKAILKDWAFDQGSWKEKTVDEQTCNIKSTTDVVKCEFVAKAGGVYTITARVLDDRERPNESQLTVWVPGGKQPPKRTVEQEEAQIIPNKKDYQPGDVAEILVQSPFVPAEGVLTLRRNGIVKTEHFTMNEASAVLKIPLEEKYLPNIIAQVDLVGSQPRTNDAGDVDPKLAPRPAFATGQINLQISTDSRKLNVSAEPEAKTLAPGGETKIDVAVKDNLGKAVSNSEVAVVVVDESVLALSGYRIGNPLDVFYTQRDEGVNDYHSRAHIVLGNAKDIRQIENLPINGRAVSEQLSISADGAVAGAMPPPAPMAKMRAMKSESATFSSLLRTDNESIRAEPLQSAINLRTNFNALVVFAPNVKTDSSGHALVPIKLPDNLTRYRIMAVAVDTNKKFGGGESNITAKQPLMARPSAPRFLNFGDKAELPVVVQNQTDKPMTVDVAVRATNAELTAGGGRKVVVPANDRVEVRFPITTVKAGTARFQIATTSGSYADAAEISLPVWTPATTEAFATYGTTDQNGAIVQPVQAPKDVFPQFGGLEVTTSSTQLQELTDAFIYLYRYKFECSEQVASRMISIAALRDVLQAFKAKDMPTKEELDASFARDIEILKGRQREDGSFGLWGRQRERYEYPFLTVHVAHALALAKQKGYNVPDEMLNKTKPYLKNVEKYFNDDWYKKSPQVRWTISAYTLYVRDLIGDKDAAKAKALLKEATIEKMPFEALGWILSVLANDKNSSLEVEAIKHFLMNRTTETAATANFVTDYGDAAWLIMYSNRRADGVLLEALIKADPTNDLIPKLVRGLLDHRKEGRWENTQENVFILLALDKYFNAFEKITPDFVARVWLGSAYAGEQQFRARSINSNLINIPMSYLIEQNGAANLILDKQGAGRLYYRIGMKYAPKNLRLAPADYGFTVLRTYEAIDDANDVKHNADGSWTFKSGARVRVRLTMVASARRYHVALVDPLPAGLEILNPELAVTESLPADRGGNTPLMEVASRSYGRNYYYWRWTWFEHQNFRDERAEAFSSLLWEGVYKYTYVTRATTPGDFVVPPAKAEEMYHPETFGRTGTDFVKVE